jgi:hypothetical protein
MLASLTEEKVELFFRAFEIMPVGKRREEKMDAFTNHLMPRLLKLNPNAMTFLHFLIEQLRSSSDVVLKFRDVPLPIFFTKAKTARPVFKFFPMSMQGFDVFPSQKERRAEPYVLGSWLTITDPSPTCPIYVDKAEVAPTAFGGTENWYLLSTDGRAQSRLQVNFQSHPPGFLTWFVIQFVERRPITEVFKELTPLAASATEATLLARTPYCKGCTFLVVPALVELSSKGSGRCPVCGAPVILSELQFEVKQRPEATPSPFVAPPPRGEDPEMHKARISLGDTLGQIINFTADDHSWADSLFRDAQGWGAEPRLMSYHGTQEFLDLMQNMT